MNKIKNTINFLLKHKKISSFIVVFLFFSLFAFLFVNYVQAAAPVIDTIQRSILTILNNIMATVLAVLGIFIGILVIAVVWVAQINNFIEAPAVGYGWVIVRDLSNMFFILILLVIAFATILRVESYNVKRLLPRLLIMAVLINFSKTICGLIIDASQVVMLTFVSSFADVNGFNFINMMGLNGIVQFNKGGSVVADSLTLFSSYFLGIIYLLISTIVMAVLLAVLIYRVIMLWIYIVLSPLAYLMASFPQGQGYASNWWKDFLDYVTVGPILAFFIWLSFISMGGVTGTGNADLNNVIPQNTSKSQLQVLEGAPETLTEAGRVDHLIKFAIAIGMLIGGLMIAQKSSGLAGKAATNGLAAVKRIGAGVARPATSLATSAGGLAKTIASEGGKEVKTMAGRVALGSAGKILQNTGIDSLKKLGNVSSNLAGDINKTRGEERTSLRTKTLKSFGFRNDTESLKSLDQFMDTRLAKNFKTGALATGSVTLGIATGGASTVTSGLLGIATVAQGLRTAFADYGREEVAAKKAKDEDVVKNSKKTRDENIERETSSVAREKEVSLKVIEQEKQDKLKDFEAENGQSSNNPLNKDKYDQGVKDITKSYDEKIENTTKSYDEKISETKLWEEKKHQERLTGDQGTRSGKLTKARDEALADVKLKIDSEVNQIKTDPSLDQEAKDNKIKKVELKREKEEKKITDEYQANNKLLNSPFNNKLLNSLADYHPQKVTKDAIKKERSVAITIDKQIKVLAGGENIDKFGGSTFYSPSGFSPAQNQFYEKATADSDEAKEARASILKRLKEVAEAQGRTNTLNGDGIIKPGELSNLEDFKKGLAAFSKEGGDNGRFIEIISELNKIKTKGDEDPRTVESYEPSVITKKT